MWPRDGEGGVQGVVPYQPRRRCCAEACDAGGVWGGALEAAMNQLPGNASYVGIGVEGKRGA